MTVEKLLQIPPFSLGKAEKEKVLTASLLALTKSHMESCPPYAAMMRARGLDVSGGGTVCHGSSAMIRARRFDVSSCGGYRDIPFLPVSLFKDLDLKSVPDEAVFKVITSSGTTGQNVSKIYLDRITAANQQRVLVKIVSDFTGAARLPMLIIDSPSVIKNRDMFSARGAGILGFSVFGTDRVYALDEDMKLNLPAVEAFAEKYRGKRILLFGFTFMVWLHFYRELIRIGYTPDLRNGILIHGGGWKKLSSQAVSRDDFKQRLRDVCGISHIHDYYGMAEQTGCIYMECEYGHLHASVFSDVITRNYKDFSICAAGEAGILQVVSVLPESYPGHSLLSEDEGVILGEDCCPCGRMGKFFKLNGRLKMAEIRGCSDTYERFN